MQRCASHMASKTDVDESVKIGEEAVKAADEKINKRGDNNYSIEALLNTLPDYLKP